MYVIGIDNYHFIVEYVEILGRLFFALSLEMHVIDCIFSFRMRLVVSDCNVVVRILSST